jgi:transcriptional regulator with XRE-family HTH domain/KaiC/GvpD/RAD55 family RecA-like ATPase
LINAADIANREISFMSERVRVTSGVSQLDRLLGGLYIGDNVVWHDDAGSLGLVFCMNFMLASQAQGKPLIYLSFDRSPKNLLDQLGTLADNPLLTILDCFTYGKGDGTPVFLKFYQERREEPACKFVTVQKPREPEQVIEALYATHSTMQGDVRFVFESLTGMQEIWGGEEQILNFYSHSCPRLYDLNTVAYWLMEKRAHSQRLRAQINQIAQVAVDLSVRRGTTSLMILKAERRDIDTLNKPYSYWTKDLNVTFDHDKRTTGRFDLGLRLKELRSKRGISQTELAKLVGVTPSTISQIESNMIYPSLPGLLKIAEVLTVEVSSLFQDRGDLKNRVIFPAAEAVEVKLQGLPEEAVSAKSLSRPDFEQKAEPYLLEIQPKKEIPAHFFLHKGEEMGYLLSGVLRVKIDKAVHTVRPGDVIYLTSEMPTQWKNPGPSVARLLWLKIR